MNILYKSVGRIDLEEAEFLALNIFRLFCGILLTFMTKVPIILEHGSRMPGIVSPPNKQTPLWTNSVRKRKGGNYAAKQGNTML